MKQTFKLENLSPLEKQQLFRNLQEELRKQMPNILTTPNILEAEKRIEDFIINYFTNNKLELDEESEKKIRDYLVQIEKNNGQPIIKTRFDFNYFNNLKIMKRVPIQTNQNTSPKTSNTQKEVSKTKNTTNNQDINSLFKDIPWNLQYDIKELNIGEQNLKVIQVFDIPDFNPRGVIEKKMREYLGNPNDYITFEEWAGRDVNVYYIPKKKVEELKKNIVNSYSTYISEVAKALDIPYEQLKKAVESRIIYRTGRTPDKIFFTYTQSPAYYLEQLVSQNKEKIIKKYGESYYKKLFNKVNYLHFRTEENIFKKAVIKTNVLKINRDDFKEDVWISRLNRQLNQETIRKIDELINKVEDPIKKLELRYEKMRLLGQVKNYSITNTGGKVRVKVNYSSGKWREYVYPIENIAGKKIILGLESPSKVVEELKKEIKETGDLSKLFDLKEAYQTAREYRIEEDYDRVGKLGARIEYYLERRDRDLWDDVDRWNRIREKKEIAQISEQWAKKFAEVFSLKDFDKMAKSAYNQLVANAMQRAISWGILDYSWKDNVKMLKEIDKLIPDDLDKNPEKVKQINIEKINKLKESLVKNFIDDALRNYRSADLELAKQLENRVSDLLNKARNAKSFEDYMSYLTKAKKVNRKLASLDPSRAYDSVDIKLISTGDLINKMEQFNKTKDLSKKEQLLKEIKSDPRSKLTENQIIKIEDSLSKIKEQQKILNALPKNEKEFLSAYNKFASDSLKKKHEFRLQDDRLFYIEKVKQRETIKTNKSVKEKESIDPLKETDLIIRQIAENNSLLDGTRSMTSKEIEKQLLLEKSKNKDKGKLTSLDKVSDFLGDIAKGIQDIGDEAGKIAEKNAKRLLELSGRDTKNIKEVSLDNFFINFYKGLAEGVFDAASAPFAITSKALDPDTTLSKLKKEAKEGFNNFVKEVKEKPVSTLSYAAGQTVTFGAVSKLGKVGKVVDVSDDLIDLSQGYGVFQYLGTPIEKTARTTKRIVKGTADYFKDIATLPKEIKKLEQAQKEWFAEPKISIKGVKEIKGKEFGDKWRTYDVRFDAEIKEINIKNPLENEKEIKNKLVRDIIKDAKQRLNRIVNDLTPIKKDLDLEVKVENEFIKGEKISDNVYKVKSKTKYFVKNSKTEGFVKVDEVEKEYKGKFEFKKPIKVGNFEPLFYKVDLVENKPLVINKGTTRFKGEKVSVRGVMADDLDLFRTSIKEKNIAKIDEVKEFELKNLLFNKEIGSIKKGGKVGGLTKTEEGKSLVIAEKNPLGLPYKAKPMSFKENKEVEVLKPKKEPLADPLKGFERLLEKQFDKIENRGKKSTEQLFNNKNNNKGGAKSLIKEKGEEKVKEENRIDKVLESLSYKIESKLDSKRLFRKIEEKLNKKKMEREVKEKTKEKGKTKTKEMEVVKPKFALLTTTKHKLLGEDLVLTKVKEKEREIQIPIKVQRHRADKKTEHKIRLKLKTEVKQEPKLEQKFDFKLDPKSEPKLDEPKIDNKEELKRKREEEPSKRKKKEKESDKDFFKKIEKYKIDDPFALLNVENKKTKKKRKKKKKKKLSEIPF